MEINESTEKEEKGQRTGQIPSLRDWIENEGSDHLSRSGITGFDVGDLGLIPGLERYPCGKHGNPLQYSCLENSMDRGAWRATVRGVAKSLT